MYNLLISLNTPTQNEELDKKYAGLLEKKWTSVIRLQKKVSRDLVDLLVSKVITESEHSSGNRMLRFFFLLRKEKINLHDLSRENSYVPVAESLCPS